MDTTFISIHDLSDSAIILYSSESVVDILGYTPDELVNQSAWDLFPEEELPYAHEFHRKRVSSDKAAVLAYCRVRHRDGYWVGCECCFTIVYDVMIVCTSIYNKGASAEKRAAEAPLVRRVFSSSPKDPRYHMLSHISAKFAQPAKAQEHEPRAALFLNRYTRTLTIMYATSGLVDVIGIPADEMRGRSFYYCIAENCLQDAVKCLENAKGNDSIAYLRFWFRDPRLEDTHDSGPDDSDEEMTTEMSEDFSEGGVQLEPQEPSPPHLEVDQSNGMEIDGDGSRMGSRQSSGDSVRPSETHAAIFGEALQHESSASSVSQSPDGERASFTARPSDNIELEAVISCASDGLVVCLRRARPMIPHPTHRPSRPVYENGLFAAPWALDPTLPPLETRGAAGFGAAFAPSLGPQGARAAQTGHHAGAHRPPGGPAQHDFMSAIRDQAIFAWALTGINGSLAEFSQGKPRGNSLPKDGLPIWASDSAQKKGNGSDGGTSGGYHSGGDGPGASARSSRHPSHIFGDPGLDRSRESGSRSASRSASSANGHSNGGSPFAGFAR